FSPLAHLRNLATPHVSYRLCRAVGASPTAQAGVAEEMEKLPGLWQQAAAGRRRHRAGLLRGVPARQARPPRPTGLRSHEAPGVRATGPQASALPSKAAPARVGTPTPLAGGAWAKPSSTDCGPLSHLRHNAACELVSPDNSLRTYVFPTIERDRDDEEEGRGEPPAAVPRGDAAAPRGARHHSSCARPSVTSRLTQSLPRLPSAAASCSRTARPMDTAP
ncbi:unnamed protein product, partial [Prorocentrum cordatum]